MRLHNICLPEVCRGENQSRPSQVLQDQISKLIKTCHWRLHSCDHHYPTKIRSLTPNKTLISEISYQRERWFVPKKGSRKATQTVEMTRTLLRIMESQNSAEWPIGIISSKLFANGFISKAYLNKLVKISSTIVYHSSNYQQINSLGKTSAAW